MRDLCKDEVVFVGQQFLNSFLCGRFVKSEIKGETCAYYFTSQFQVVSTSAFVLGYSPTKAGAAKHSDKVYADDTLVIIEYPNCGTLAINPRVNESIANILEGQ